MSAWVSLLWDWGLPLLAALPTLARARAAYRAQRRGLLRPRGWRWLLGALVAAQALIWCAHRALTHPTNLWLPGLGLALVGLMLLATRAARAETHVGLRGFQRALPRDGLEIIENAPRHNRDFLLALPALSLLFALALYHPERRLDFLWLGIITGAPLTLIPYRAQWLAPAWMLAPLAVLLAHAWSARPTLPPGDWTTPIGGARCAGQVRVVAPRAWCFNPFTHTLYGFNLGTGLVVLEAQVPEGARLFAASADTAWVQQIPASGLIRVDAAGQEKIPVLSARFGAADALNRLWVIDVGQELTRYAGDAATPIRARDGLLNNTANVVKVSPAGEVWVGSIGGASVLRGEVWQTYAFNAVINFAFGAEGQVWLVWQARPGYGALTDWGASELVNGAVARHIEIGRLTGLEAPRNEDALAADGRGRLWFTTQSIPRREKFLGVLDETGRIYSLGHFATTGPHAYNAGTLWATVFGVASDGAGGVVLFNGEDEGWKRWRP